MGYLKEIILYQKDDQKNPLTPTKLFLLLEEKGWTIAPTVNILDKGNEFDWITAENKQEFLDIIEHKEMQNEYISYKLYSQKEQRYLSIDIHDGNKAPIITFELNIKKNEGEWYWFQWYDRKLSTIIKPYMKKIEWRSNDNNNVIKLIKPYSKIKR